MHKLVVATVVVEAFVHPILIVPIFAVDESLRVSHAHYLFLWPKIFLLLHEQGSPLDFDEIIIRIV